jgi:hypothetical protein
MSIGEGKGKLDRPDAQDREKLRNQYDTIYLRESLCTQSNLHIYEDCGSFPNSDDYEPEEKALAVYPPGHKQWCKLCYHRWQQGERY